MDFDADKIPAEIIKEGAFGGTYFRDIYSYVNCKWYKMVLNVVHHYNFGIIKDR